MGCLSQRAYEILKAEVLRCSSADVAGQVQRDIALKRLEKLRLRSGTRLGLEELRTTLNDLYPNFNESVLKQAARANRPPNKLWGQIKITTIALSALAGGIWVLNLPYPMIRWPVANTVPLVLLPSFLSMDHNYRQAIAQVEQADQLVNKATSAADFELGATKVAAAQKHLNALPVWFLGYYPQAYCGWFQCTWRFTLDEFQQARKDVARMEARLFQETNAQTKLDQTNQTVTAAKQQYKATSDATARQQAIAQWQQAMDTMQEIPRETLAGRNAQTKLVAYQRDFQEVVGLNANTTQATSLIQSAQEFAKYAQVPNPKVARSIEEWQKSQTLWQDAIELLTQIKPGDPDFLAAQKLLAQYKNNLGQTTVRLQQEQKAATVYEQAQQQTTRLLETARTLEKNQIAAQLYEIRTTLKSIPSNTTVYGDAQELMKNAARAEKQRR